MQVISWQHCLCLWKNETQQWVNFGQVFVTLDLGCHSLSPAIAVVCVNDALSCCAVSVFLFAVVAVISVVISGECV